MACSSGRMKSLVEASDHSLCDLNACLVLGLSMVARRSGKADDVGVSLMLQRSMACLLKHCMLVCYSTCLVTFDLHVLLLEGWEVLVQSLMAVVHEVLGPWKYEPPPMMTTRHQNLTVFGVNEAPKGRWPLYC